MGINGYVIENMRFVFVQKWICSQLMAAWRNGKHDFKEHDILGQTIFKQTPRISVVSITLMVWPHIGPASKLDSPEIPKWEQFQQQKL